MNQIIKKKEIEKKLSQIFYRIVYFIGAVSILLLIIAIPFTGKVMLGPAFPKSESGKSFTPKTIKGTYVMIKEYSENGSYDDIINTDGNLRLTGSEIEERSQKLVLIYVDQSGKVLSEQVVSGVLINSNM